LDDQTPIPAAAARRFTLADTLMPEAHLLTNGRYSVMLTNVGGGYSVWNGLAVTRFREDATRDCWGTFLYLRDVGDGRTWSAALQPTMVPPADYEVTFTPDRAQYRRRDGDVEALTEVVVSPDDDVEVRRLTLTNCSDRPREIEVTSYFEAVLAPQAADHSHRAFSNLFVETFAVEPLNALLFTRRPRSTHEARYWGVHSLVCSSEAECVCSYETDRARFLGRLRSSADPVALDDDALSGSVGAVLDPVCSIRRSVRIASGESVSVSFITGVAETRDDAEALAATYRQPGMVERAFEHARSASDAMLSEVGISPEEAADYQRLASRLLYTDPDLRATTSPDIENELPVSGLWGLGISGDYPILLVNVGAASEIALARQALTAQRYWRRAGFIADLVILDTRADAVAPDLDARLQMLLAERPTKDMLDKPGGVFVRRAGQIDPTVLGLLRTVARVVLAGDKGPLGSQLESHIEHPPLPDMLEPSRARETCARPEFVRPELAFDNGFGGFDPERNEYVIVLADGLTTPVSWDNIIANEEFGTMVSEAGIGCTWAGNSHENRLTTWNNDPIADGTGEAFYLRDEETGEFWSPTPLPVGSLEPHIVRHGRGYSVFEHTSHGIASELTWFVPRHDTIRIARLRLTNTSERHRMLSATHFVEWTLGTWRSSAQHQVTTGYDPQRETLTARNWFNADFPGQPAFLACTAPIGSHTASRTEFLGRNGALADPAAMHRAGLAGAVGRYLDSCGALLVPIALAPGESAELSFLIGQTATAEESAALVERYRQPGRVDEALVEVREFWSELLDTIQVHTPDAALDLMVNGHALYQALACRIWGRSALYQSSGAYGFRDQLQDTLCLLSVRPEIVRAQIIEASRHQFEAGDVLHWWMPVSGRGVRTHFSDDRHWLPFIVTEYIEATGDVSVLDEVVPFIEGPELPADRDDNYMEPTVSERSGTVYEHCVAALEAGRPTGAHGLPLMGGGDWNDGMNRVGVGGKGESVWLAWFLNVILTRFAPLCEARGDTYRAASYRTWSAAIVGAIETNAWDGDWYRRAFYDDGTALGTKSATEARIDSIAQSWSVISGAGDPNRARQAMASLSGNLVRPDDRLVLLLTPPFADTPEDPGYIKGYLAGVRENGGQYTHAATWVALAYLMLGDGDAGLGVLDLLNPVNHALTHEAATTYHVEPYAIVADVYSNPQHVGRGGWTWYTGSASWFYNVSVRHLLGLRVLAEPGGDRYLEIDPCIPKGWSGFSATYRVGPTTTVEISVENPTNVSGGVSCVEIDGQSAVDGRVPLVDDERVCKVRVVLGEG
jgi:cyclic beta-1,2-glucan synthetase